FFRPSSRHTLFPYTTLFRSYANLPEETGWYAARSEGSWKTVFTVLALGHFVAPFAFLMSRHMKRNKLTLAAAAVFLLVMHWLDIDRKSTRLNASHVKISYAV